MTGWRSMESAPRDQSDILLVGSCIEVGFWGANCRTWVDFYGYPIEPVPTHWQPLPDPPEEGIC